MTHDFTISPLFLFPFVLVGCLTLAYLLGSIPFGLILGKMYGVGDIRKIGSGNIGATNMLRTGKRNLALATLLLDGAKGFVAVMLCSTLLSLFAHSDLMSTGNIRVELGHIPYLFGLLAVMGHVWPVWLNYKGGKGVATAIGVFLASAPLIGVLIIVCWLAVFFLSRYSSLSALVSICLSPVAGYLLVNGYFAGVSLFIAAIVVFKHKDNIRRLRNKTETKWSKTREAA